ncbi:MAG: sulfotransferase [Lysobacteraceae bacterium]|nr:MAG: sulfotransferase [Xanthomonadaceae bacterium]
MNELSKAVAHYRTGEYSQAARLARAATNAQPKEVRAWELLAASALRIGERDTAVSALEVVCRLRPTANAWQQLGQCLIDAGREEEALGPLHQWLRLEPNPPLAAVKSLASMNLNHERYDQSRTLWERVWRADPSSPDAPAALSYLSEISNDLVAAERYAQQALEIDSTNALARLTTSQLALRSGNPMEAIESLQTLLQDPALTSVNRSLALYRLAKAYDQLGKYNAAWDATVQAGQTLSAQVTKTPSTYSLSAIAELQGHFETFDYKVWAKKETKNDPVFLVGFPRSGTTLTERILSSHTSISCIEEKDTLGPILRRFVNGSQALTSLNDLVSDEIDDWRDKYFQQVEKHADRAKTIVDKMPMDSIYLGLIYRFFPNAKIIFALRDPRDVVLSCFMQSFALNDAMRHFLSIDDTTRYYAASMRLATTYLDSVPLNIRLHRYEDLVEDTETQARALFDFLQMPWQSEVLSYHSRSSENVINTPSYTQVSKPIYKGALARWRNYEQQLQPYLHRLEPYIQRFGYGAD